MRWAVVEAQLIELVLQTPESRGSNPVIGNFYLLSIVFEVLNKAVNGPLLCK